MCLTSLQLYNFDNRFQSSLRHASKQEYTSTNTASGITHCSSESSSFALRSKFVQGPTILIMTQLPILHPRFITVTLATLSFALPDVLQPHDDRWSGCISANGVNRSTPATAELSASFCAVLTKSDAAVADMLYVDGPPNCPPGRYQHSDSN